jgi:ABC-type glycerol-3-phosphate transport system substrate-binding protein
MNHRIVKVVKLPAAAALLASAVACGSPAPDQKPAEQKAASPVVADGPAELVFYSWGNQPEESFNELYGDAIRKKFPNYTIKYVQRGTKSVQDLIVSGQQIDIYFDSIGNFANTLIANKMEYDMTELVKTFKVDTSRFEPTVMDAMKMMSGGKLYGLPISNTTLVLYYNKSVFDRFGVGYPKNGMTWDETFEIVKKLTRTDNGKTYRGISFTVVHPLRMNPYSLPMVDSKTGKAAINNDKWKAVFQTAFVDPYKDWDAASRAGAKGISFKSFTDKQEYGMMVDLSSNPALQAELLNQIEWDMVSMPTYKDLPGVGAQLYPTYASITAQSKFKNQAMNVITYLTSDEYQMESSRKGTMPAITSDAAKKALGQSTKFKDKNFQAMYMNKFAPIAYKTLMDYDLEKLYTADVNKLSAGTIDINSYLRSAEEKGNKLIESLEKK